MPKKRRLKLSELTQEQRNNLFNKHRIKVLAKYINRNYLNDDRFKYKATSELELVINNEIIKGLDEEFCILTDDPNDPLIKELVRDKTEEIIKEIYK
jgi:hypothetical protein